MSWVRIPAEEVTMLINILWYNSNVYLFLYNQQKTWRLETTWKDLGRHLEHQYKKDGQKVDWMSKIKMFHLDDRTWCLDEKKTKGWLHLDNEMVCVQALTAVWNRRITCFELRSLKIGYWVTFFSHFRRTFFWTRVWNERMFFFSWSILRAHRVQTICAIDLRFFCIAMWKSGKFIWYQKYKSATKKYVSSLAFS